MLFKTFLVIDLFGFLGPYYNILRIQTELFIFKKALFYVKLGLKQFRYNIFL
jgi:hypothetical protein